MSDLTVEELAADCLDVRELYKAGVLDGEWVTFRWPEIRWPAVRKMRAARYRVLIELQNQVVPQQVHVSWTKCNYGGTRPWLHCLCGRRVARLFKGFGGYFCRPCYVHLCDRLERLEQPLIGSRVLRHAPLWIRPLTY
jgi:hypothetical protein